MWKMGHQITPALEVSYMAHEREEPTEAQRSQGERMLRTDQEKLKRLRKNMDVTEEAKNQIFKRKSL